MPISATSHREPERLPDIVAAPGDGEPFEGEAGRREVEAAVVGGERIEQDEGERQVEEQQAAGGRGLQAPAGPRAAPAAGAQSASKAPSRLAAAR